MNQDRLQSRRMLLFRILLVWTIAWSGMVVSQRVVAASQGPAFVASLKATSHYIWRGFELSGSNLHVQPSVTAIWQKWAVNLWANYDTDPPAGIDNWNEVDFTIAYTLSFEPATLTLSYIYYLIDEIDDSQELFARLQFNLPANPNLTVYRELNNYPGWYLVAGIGHSIPLAHEISLDLTATAGLLWSDEADSYAEPGSGDPFRDFLNGHLKAALTIPLDHGWTITPELNYSFPLNDTASDLIESRSMDGDDDSFFYVGLTVGVTF